MKLEEIKQQSNQKVLLRGKSSLGKTLAACMVALNVSEEGHKVKYVDTEAEGSTTIVHLVESGQYDEESVENVEYVQADSYDHLSEHISYNRQAEFDLLVVDTLDHKHTYSILKVNDDNRAVSADWNKYPDIYGYEKAIMDTLGKAKTNILCTLDPESGSMDKPKGTQTNIHGYFNIVVDLKWSGDDRVSMIRNWIGRNDWIGKKHPDHVDAITKDILERI